MRGGKRGGVRECCGHCLERQIIQISGRQTSAHAGRFLLLVPVASAKELHVGQVDVQAEPLLAGRSFVSPGGQPAFHVDLLTLLQVLVA